MATKKKVAAKKAPARAGSKRSSSMTTTARLVAETQVVQLMVAVFTMLSVIFALMAYWRYH